MNKKRVALGCVGILAVFICFGLFGAILSIGREEVAEESTAMPETAVVEVALVEETAVATETVAATEQPTNTAVPTDTAVPAPTNTPQPTNTPEPTDTPQPTNTPRPTNTPAPTEDARAANYISEVVRLAGIYEDALSTFAELSTEAGENPVLLFDEDWRLNMAVVLVVLKQNRTEVHALTPPPGYEEANDYFVEASDHFANVSDLMIEGIDDVDAEKILQAQEEMLLGTAAIQNATLELGQLNNP